MFGDVVAKFWREPWAGDIAQNEWALASADAQNMNCASIIQPLGVALERPPSSWRRLERLVNGIYHIYSGGIDSNRSNTPLFVISGNKNLRQISASRHSSSSLGHILGRIERDSQNWTRRRSRSNHCPRNGSPKVASPSASMVKRVQSLRRGM